MWIQTVSKNWKLCPKAPFMNDPVRVRNPKHWSRTKKRKLNVTQNKITSGRNFWSFEWLRSSTLTSGLIVKILNKLWLKPWKNIVSNFFWPLSSYFQDFLKDNLKSWRKSNKFKIAQKFLATIDSIMNFIRSISTWTTPCITGLGWLVVLMTAGVVCEAAITVA